MFEPLKIRATWDPHRPAEQQANTVGGFLLSNMRPLKRPPSIPEDDSVEPSSSQLPGMSAEHSCGGEEMPSVPLNVSAVLPPRDGVVGDDNSSAIVQPKNNPLPPVIPTKSGLLRRPSGPPQSALLTRKPTPGPMRAFQIQPQHLVSKPPLPDAPPVIPKLMPRMPIVAHVPSPAKKGIVNQERSKSTPPSEIVSSELSLPMVVDKARYHSVSDDDDGSGDKPACIEGEIDNETESPETSGDGKIYQVSEPGRRLSEGFHRVSLLWMFGLL